MERVKNILGIDHIGYAVNDIGAAKNSFSALGYSFHGNMVDDFRNVIVCVGENGGVRVELLAPLPEKKSPIDGYLKKIGNTPYHLCYQVDNMDVCVAELQNAGFTMLGTPAPSVPLGGDVCFLYSMEIGMIELIYYSKECGGER